MISTTTARKKGNAQRSVVIGLAILLMAGLLAGLFYRLLGTPLKVPAPSPSSQVSDAKGDAAARSAAEKKAAAEKHDVVAEATTPDSGAANKKKSPKPGALLKGRVLRRDNDAPIAGARVQTEQIAIFTMGERTETVDSILTGEDGKFEIKPLEITLGQQKAAALAVSADGYESQIIYLGYEKDGDIEFKLGPGAAISGRVISETKSPVAGASVMSELFDPSMPGSMQNMGEPRVFAQAVSGENGSFTLSGLAKDGGYQLNVRALHYQPLLSESIAAGTSGVELILKPGRTRIFGKVTTPDDKPVAGAAVQIMSQNEMGGNMMEMLAKIQHASTKEDGSYEIEGLKSGQFVVVAMRSVTNPMGGMVNRQVTLKDGEEQELNLQFPKGMHLSGHAINADTNQPLAGVNVSREPFGGGSMFGMKLPSFAKNVQKSPSVMTGGDGKFVLEDLAPMGMGALIYFQPPPGMISDIKSANPMMPMMPEGSLMVSVNEKGELGEVELRFRAAGKLNGVVYLSDGTTTVADVKVTASAKNPSYDKDARTNEKGRFSIEVPPGRDMVVRAATEVAAASATAMYSEKGKTEDITLILKNFASISGTVKDSAGAPVKGINVRLRAKSSDEGGDSFGMAAMMGDGSPQGISGVDGHYEITKIEPGEIEVKAALGGGMFSFGTSKEASKYASSEPVTVTLAEGEKKDGVDIILESGDALEGTVKDEADKPIPDAPVMSFGSDGGGGMKQVKTDADGKFTIEGLGADQSVSLQVNHPEYNPETKQNVSTKDSPIEIVLKKRPSVLLTVKRANGSAVKDYKYEMLRGAGGKGNWMPAMDVPSAEVHNADGTAKLDKLTNGNWRVEVHELVESGASGRMGSEEFDLKEAGKEEKVDVTVDDGRKITGKVINGENGPPVSGAEVSGSRVNRMFATMMGQSATPGITATTDANGEFTLTPILPGSLKLTVSAENLFTKGDVAVDVPSDRDPEPVTIVLIGAGSIAGTVTDFDGKPVAGATLTLYLVGQLSGMFGNADSQKTVQTDANGAYRIDNLAPSTYKVSLTSNIEGVKEDRMVTVAAGEAGVADFNFASFIVMSGLVTLNGKPFAGSNYELMSIREGGGTRTPLELDADSKYKINVKPGRYSVYMMPKSGIFGFRGTFSNSLVASIEVAETPREQQHDISLDLVDATVALVFPTEKEFVGGNVSVSQVITDPALLPGPGTGLQASTASVAVKNLLPGQYKATFHGNEGDWYGVSDAVTLTPGGENILVVDVKKPAMKKKVGEWKLDGTKKDMADYDVNLSSEDLSSGDYDVMFEYTSGAEALAIDSIAVLSNGSEVGRDTHAGWSGMSKRENVYRFTIKGSSTGSKFTLRSRYKANGISNGDIFLIRN